MDNISFTELDTFTADMIRRVAKTKERVEHLLEMEDIDHEDEVENILETKPIQSLTKSKDIDNEIMCHNTSPIKERGEEVETQDDSKKKDEEGIEDSLEDGEEDLSDDDHELLNQSYQKGDENFRAKIRESISKLLDVNDDTFYRSTVSTAKIGNEEEVEHDSTGRKPTRLTQRLSALTRLYSESSGDVDGGESVKKNVLSENNGNRCKDKVSVKKVFSETTATTCPLTGIPRGNLKARLNDIARMYFPVSEETEPETIKVESKSKEPELVSIQPRKQISEVKPKLFQEVKPSKEVEMVVKQTSVADLKKVFEEKVKESGEVAAVTEKAPELLSLREKRKLFEQAIREENEAARNVYRPAPPPKRVIDLWEPKKSGVEDEEKEEPEMKKIRKEEPPATTTTPSEEATEEMVQEVFEELEKVPETIADDNNVELEEVQPQESSMEVEEVEVEPTEADASEKQHFTIGFDAEADITFSAIDNDQTANVVCLEEDRHLYPDLALEAPGLTRQSTMSTISDSSIASMPPEKPPRTYEHDEVVEMEPSDIPRRTISNYRLLQKQKKDAEKCADYLSVDEDVKPAKMVRFEQQSEVEHEEKEEGEKESVQRSLSPQEMIKSLQEEIEKHNQIFSQASTALSMCLGVPDLQHSEPRIEAERLLLVSNEKRLACLTEIKRIRRLLHNIPSRPVESYTRGTLRISGLTVPLKKEFVVIRAKSKVPSSHQFVCLVYHGAKVFFSKMLSTAENLDQDSLRFDFQLNVLELKEDFVVHIKLFELKLSREEKQSKSTPLKTLRRRLGSSAGHRKDSKAGKTVDGDASGKAMNEKITRMTMASNFKLVGTVQLTLCDVRSSIREVFKLESPHPNPDTILDGYAKMSLSLSVTHGGQSCGSYDIKEPDSDFWNARWVILDGHYLRYWRFKSEMDSREPVGVINLKHCINPNVQMLSGELKTVVCRRSNTLPLVTLEPPEVPNSHKLIHGGRITKPHSKIYLISSSVKEMAESLCQQIQTTLRNVRVWETDNVRPFSQTEFEKLLKSH